VSIIIGLTGQSGAGKSTVSRVFTQEGFAVIDCDAVARRVTEAGSDCNRELSEYFPECFDESYVLDREKMARIVFSDRESLELLERIEFKYITAEINRIVEELSEKSDYIVLDAPTLFEAGIDGSCDVTAAVLSDEQLRLGRIMQRDGVSAELAKKRFSSQHDEDFFREKCTLIIENNGTLAEAERSAQEAARTIKGMFGNACKDIKNS
jgi:dephospho-CoA kinase